MLALVVTVCVYIYFEERILTGCEPLPHFPNKATPRGIQGSGLHPQHNTQVDYI